MSARNTFYRDLGLDRRVELDKHITLEVLFGPNRAGAQHVASSLTKFLTTFEI